eukprot:jgi/Hompol1/2/HPOL_000584-RA
MAENDSQAMSDTSLVMAKMLRAREALRDVMLKRIRGLVVPQLGQYKVLLYEYTILASADLRAHKTLVDKEKKKQDQLNDAMSKDTDGTGTGKINEYQLELAQTSQSLIRSKSAIYNTALAFEKQKREDLKKSLSELIWSEMQFHAKTLETLTEAHQTVQRVDFGPDIEARFAAHTRA